MISRVVPKMLSKFRGCLAGAVVGDCLGSPWEGCEGVFDAAPNKLSKYFDNLKIGKVPRADSTGNNQIRFTDDTAMARSVAESVIEKKDLDTKDLAFRFQEEYFKKPMRGYGAGVITVFMKLRDMFEEGDDFDEFEFARQQFGGSGSYGNGGAMRIAPMGLYTCKRPDEELEDLVTRTTQLTHSNKKGILGTILQCYAIQHALNQSGELDSVSFVDTLISKMAKLEGRNSDSLTNAQNMSEHEEVPETYTDKLLVVKSFLQSKEKVPNIDVITYLGNHISALGSVPTAVYSFLRCSQPVEGLEQLTTPIERTVGYAMTLGGDTDTIATMAAAITGAYYGIECIPQEWLKCSEGTDDAIRQAGQLHQLCFPD